MMIFCQTKVFLNQHYDSSWCLVVANKLIKIVSTVFAFINVMTIYSQLLYKSSTNNVVIHVFTLDVTIPKMILNCTNKNSLFKILQENEVDFYSVGFEYSE